jgi:ketosteroid isomerase-like protein
METPMGQEEELLATLDAYADAYCAKDADRLMGLFDAGDDISVIGTGGDELCSGRGQVRALFERNFAEATAREFEWHWRHVTVAGDTGVVATTLTIHLDLEGEPLQVPIRWTVALRQTEDGWVWLHRHASSAAGSQDDGQAYPTN